VPRQFKEKEYSNERRRTRELTIEREEGKERGKEGERVSVCLCVRACKKG
jgi:hypothetical protein